MRLVIRKFGCSGSVLAFNTTAELVDTNYVKFDRPLRKRSEEYLERIPEAAADLVRAIMALPGVVSIVLTPYQIQLEKGEAFEWNFNGVNLKMSMLMAISEFFGEIDETIDKTLEDEVGNETTEDQDSA